MSTTKFEKGTIVKFTNSEGVMDGGTIISILKDENGVLYAMLNTLEGANLRIKVDNLIPIKHQRRGVVSDKFKKRIAKEIAEYNQTKFATPPISTEIYKPKVAPRTERTTGYTPQQLEIKILKDKIADLESENVKLRDEIENIRCPYETKVLIKTVKALKQSISDGIILSDDKSQAIIPLLDLIMDFNNIQEEKKE